MPWAIMNKESRMFVSATDWGHAHPQISLSHDQAELFHGKQDARYEMAIRDLDTNHYKPVPVQVIVKLAEDGR